ncbi:radical SAM protein [Elusimicrobiota bacterium]
MFFRPDPASSAGIITNYRCTNRCIHCLYASSPEVQEIVEFKNIAKLLNQIKKNIPHCTIHIGGGEPFLNINILKETIGRINELGLLLEYVETNGVLISDDASQSMLQKLKSYGLNCILLSITPFHNEFLSLKKTEKAFSNIVEILGNNGIFPWHEDYYLFMKRLDPHLNIPFKKYIEIFSSTEISYLLNNIIYLHPAGRSAFLFARHIGKYPARRFFSKNCISECASGIHAHIDYNGNYLTGFCSGIRIGRQAGYDLDLLYNKGINYKEYPILDMVINRNIQTLYEYAKNRGFETDIDKEIYSSPCHFCLHIRTFLYFNSTIEYNELAPDFFYSEMKRKFKSYNSL